MVVLFYLYPKDRRNEMESYEHKRLTYEECRELNKGKQAKDVGETFVVSSGATVEVVKYGGCNEVSIRFKSGQESLIGAGDLRRGNVKDTFARSVYGVGYLGGGEYGKASYKSAYITWCNMLKRAYCPKFLERQPTYNDVSVCEEWHCFQNFAQWWYEQPNAGKKGYELDKDLINEGAKQYSTENCSFVPKRVNTLLTNSGPVEGVLPFGVTRHGKGFRVQISREGKTLKLGTYSCHNEAAEVYRKAKAEHVRDVVNNLKEGEVVPEVVTGLHRWANKLMS